MVVWYGGQDVGLVPETLQVLFQVGALLVSLGELSLPSLLGRKIEYQLTGWG